MGLRDGPGRSPRGARAGEVRRGLRDDHDGEAKDRRGREVTFIGKAARILIRLVPFL